MPQTAARDRCFVNQFTISSVDPLSTVFLLSMPIQPSPALPNNHGSPPASGSPGKLPFISLSVDVEALPIRSREDDKIGRLIWGKFGDKLMGIPRLIDIMEEAGAPATFFLEYLGAFRYGKKAVFEAGEYILQRGQDLQIHAHPEVIPKELPEAVTGSFGELGLEAQTRLMMLARDLYRENTGAESRIFRAGSLRFNAMTPLAARAAGFSAVSNYFGDAHRQSHDYFALPSSFEWSCGVRELTVASSIDEVIRAGSAWKDKLEALLVGPAPVRHFFIHSWSLLRLHDNGLFDSYSEEYAQIFLDVLLYLKDRCGFVGMEAPLELDHQPALVAPELIAPSAIGRSKAKFDDAGQEFARYRLFSDNQSLSSIAFRCRDTGLADQFVMEVRANGRTASLAYTIAGTRATIQLAGQPFPDPATEILDAIFRSHPQLDEIVFSQHGEDSLLASPFVAFQQSGGKDSPVARRFAGPSAVSATAVDEIIADLLARGCSLRDIHVYLGISPKTWLEAPNPAPYAFNFSVEQWPAPPAGWRGWHSPVITALHIVLDQLHRLHQPRGLFDWNATSGRTLLAATDYAIPALGGLCFSGPGASICLANFAAANLVPPDILTIGEPSQIGSLDLRGFDVFVATHPCSEAVLLEMLAVMKRASANRSGPVYFAYINCYFKDAVLNAGFDLCRDFEKGVAGWRFPDRAAIFRFDTAAAG